MRAAGCWKGLSLACAAAAGLAACHPARLGHGRDAQDRITHVADRLECPEHQGGLRRTDEAADGARCLYAGDDGETLVLTRLPLNGMTAQAALEPMEAQARRLAPVPVAPTPAPPPAAAAQDDDDTDAPQPPTPPPPPGGGAGGDHVHLDLPGLHIDTDDGGARVEGLNHTVVAAGDRATVTGSWNGSNTSIVAGDGGAVMRFGQVGQHAVDLTFLSTSKAAGPQGDHMAGYVARGPVGGPLVVAQVQARRRQEHIGIARDDALRDAKRLVARNLSF